MPIPPPGVIVRGAETGIRLGRAIVPLFGKKKKSSCRVVSAGDVDGFLNGSVSPWIVWDRVDDFAVAWGKHSGFGYAQDSVRQPIVQHLGGYRTVAELHMNVFVPMCQNLEGGESGYTTDPDSGAGLATYNRTREEFRQWIRSGAPEGSAYAPGAGEGSGSGELPTTPGVKVPALAGGGIVFAALAIGALLFGFGKK